MIRGKRVQGHYSHVNGSTSKNSEGVNWRIAVSFDPLTKRQHNHRKHQHQHQHQHNSAIGQFKFLLTLLILLLLPPTPTH